MAGKPIKQKVTLQLALSIYKDDEPMAELRRNQRGEIGHQHVKAHYAAASVHVCCHPKTAQVG